MYDNHNQLLEVAQTSDVYEELEYDLSWLMKDYTNELNLRKSMQREDYLILMQNSMF